jgi:hypothetical protein
MAAAMSRECLNPVKSQKSFSRIMRMMTEGFPRESDRYSNLPAGNQGFPEHKELGGAG